MKAINDYVVVEEIKEQKKTSGGLISVGHLAEVIKSGTIVMYDKHAGHDIAYEDSMYRVIKLRDVVLVDEPSTGS